MWKSLSHPTAASSLFKGAWFKKLQYAIHLHILRKHWIKYLSISGEVFFILKAVWFFWCVLEKLTCVFLRRTLAHQWEMCYNNTCGMRRRIPASRTIIWCIKNGEPIPKTASPNLCKRSRVRRGADWVRNHESSRDESRSIGSICRWL